MPKFKPNTSAFKMGGYSYPGASPLQQDKKKTKEDSKWTKIKNKVNEIKYKKNVKEANAKLITKFQAKHKAGEITGQELINAVKEIRQYVDY